MTDKHTPGPWRVVDGYYPCIREISGPSFKISIVMSATDISFDESMRREADANLIAAAPDLLAALIMVRDADEDCRRDGYPCMPDTPRAAIDRAINKAEGRS